jgi:probable HAF family extracellular repeat protein
VLGGAQQAASQTYYSLTAIPSLPGGPFSATPYAINNAGQVTGTSAIGNGDAFLYSAGTITDLGTLNGGGAVGQSINDAGVIVGTSLDPVNQNWSIAFVYANGTMTALPDLPPAPLDQGQCNALSINDAGLIAGACATAFQGQNPVPVLYMNGKLQVIDAPNEGVANAVNSYGQVAGSGFIYFNGNVTALPGVPEMPPFPAVPAAAAINNAGQIVGSQQTSDTIVAFFYGNGATQALPLVPTAGFMGATSINNAGQVVGIAGEGQGQLTNWQPFFYANGVLTNLNSLISPTDPSAPYVTLLQTRGINDNGWIVANGIDSRTPDIQIAYVLTPVTPYPAAVHTYAGPTAAVIGTPFTVSWTDQSVTSCTGSGGAGGDGWGGNLSIHGGQQQVTETSPGTYNFTVTCDAASGPPVSSTATINVAVPPSVTLTASPPAATTGQRITLTWSSVTVTACTGSGGSATDSWNRSQPTQGTLPTAEALPATYTYVLTCSYGALTVKAQAVVKVSYPALTVTMSASPTSIKSGGATTLTWTSANAKTCAASGGGTDDGWTNATRATSGSATITESVVVAVPLALTFTLTCSNAATGQSTAASAKVTLNPPSSGSMGGGGALDLLTLVVLLGLARFRTRVSGFG